VFLKEHAVDHFHDRAGGLRFDNLYHSASLLHFLLALSLLATMSAMGQMEAYQGAQACG
jgi:hypothetical protein